MLKAHKLLFQSRERIAIITQKASPQPLLALCLLKKKKKNHEKQPVLFLENLLFGICIVNTYC